ncbi:BRO-N domain-containing protein [Methanobrevibacter sp.]|uniref:BRO-N domain-containing protein n=1 Tax=Methanobrevibacter sp. TaxID=66852 RepID=UPI0026360D1F|nr:Bro-N domain-containing protein [uncultured Methanobrevibacter sp.]
MSNKNSIKLFEDREIRAIWDEDKEEWFFSVIDVVGVLSGSKNPTTYWRVLKKRLKDEGNETVTNCNGLKMPAPDGKMRLTDVADSEQILRIIQSIPSPNAEPFKQWLAKVGKERLDEIADPQLAIERAISNYRKKGYSEEWITQRLKTIEFRKDLTAEWDRSGVKEGLEYALLTDEITNAWSDMTTKEYKQFKDIKKENLRDNMSNIELVLNMLAEASTTEISRGVNPKGFEESKDVAKRGGSVAGDARKSLEKEVGRKVITRNNSKNPKLLDDKI